MARHGNLCIPLVLLSGAVVLAGCNSGASVSGTFDRNYKVSGPIRLELTNASGDVDITGSADGKVHVRGEVRASGFGFENPRTRLDDTLANPPIEQRGDTIRIGKEMSRMRNISIAYTIQVPRDTEVSSTLASGAQTIRGVRGPVKVQAASGVIRVEKIERDTQLTTLSGTVSATDIGNDVRVSFASGSVNRPSSCLSSVDSCDSVFDIRLRSVTPNDASRDPCFTISIDFTIAELSAASTDDDSSTFCTSPMMFCMARLIARDPVSCSVIARLRCFV